MKPVLKVPQRVHHGLLLMTALARAFGTGQAVTLEQVAAQEGISQGFLEEIAGRLRRAGFIVGRRGKAGGYVLARDPRRISVGEVITALEGPVALVECLGEAGGCPRAASCLSKNVWWRVQSEIARLLDSMTVAAVAGADRRKRRPAARRAKK